MALPPVKKEGGNRVFFPHGGKVEGVAELRTQIVLDNASLVENVIVAGR